MTSPMPPSPPSPPFAPPSIASRSSWEDAVRWGFAGAVGTSAAEPPVDAARRIVIVDPDFADWPMDDAGLQPALSAWLRQPQRRLGLLARDDGEMHRRHPRWCAWRRDWSHAIEGWIAPDGLAATLPTVLVADNGFVVELADRVHGRGAAAVDRRLARVWLERVDAVLQRSERGFAVATLGL